MTPGESPGSSPFYRRPWAAVACVVAGLVATGLLLAVWRGVPGAPLPWLAPLADLVVLSAPLLVASGIAIACFAEPGFARRVVRAVTWMDAALGVGVGLVARAAVELVAPTTGTLLAGFGEISYAAVAVVAIGAAFVTPVVEELFFRGVGVAALLDLCAPSGRVIAVAVAVAVPTAAFAAMHVLVDGGAVTGGQLLAPVLVGVGGGILFAVTGRLAAAVLAHVVFNAIGVALLIW